jgi:hypothetical protein
MIILGTTTTGNMRKTFSAQEGEESGLVEEILGSPVFEVVYDTVLLFLLSMVPIHLKSIVVTVLRSFSPAQSVRPDALMQRRVFLLSAVPQPMLSRRLCTRARLVVSFSLNHRFFMRASDLHT